MSIHPQIIEKNGKKEFVVLPYEEFLRLQEELEDYQDLKTLRDEKALAEHQSSRSLDDVLKEIPNRPEPGACT
jgi:PHD/YefM family antitoxin component YafN of YafNO toxin-antitoxin module